VNVKIDFIFSCVWVSDDDPANAAFIFRMAILIIEVIGQFCQQWPGQATRMLREDGGERPKNLDRLNRWLECGVHTTVAQR
jgi:hypothetical protein